MLAASTPSDELALLRELVRLQGGRMLVTEATAKMASYDRGCLARFGLTVSHDGVAFRFVPPGHQHLDDDDLLAALGRVDAGNRSSNDSAVADSFLLRLSSHARYKSPFQKAACRAIMTMPPGGALLTSMPTGSGKSLLFQLLAMRARETDPHATIVVVVPTIALALDHERTLRRYRGLEGSRAMPSAAEGAARRGVRDAFRRGEVPILLVSPECALGYAHDDILEAATPGGAERILVPYRLAAFVVDEAHVIEQWGRSFRTQFQRLSGLVQELRSRSPALRTVLLSATLPPSARAILANDYLTGVPALEMKAGLPRYEFDTFSRGYGDGARRDEALVELIDVLPRPAIIYTTRVADAERLFGRLREERGYARVALFTGRTGDAERREVVEAWSTDRVDLVVATSAFGMGVDKADVRAIVHACMPESSSRFYQEIGRAARDGHQAFAISLWTRNPAPNNDQRVALSNATRSWLTAETAMRRWNAIIDNASGADFSMDGTTGLRRMRIGLQAFHYGMDRGDGDHNKDWNKSLLVLLQRCGALRILAGPEGSAETVDEWHVEIIDEGLLARATPDSATWRRFAALRDAEQREALDDLTLLTRLLRDDCPDCLVTRTFEAIDPGSAGAPSCGRCPACRRRGIAAQAHPQARDVGKCWPMISEQTEQRDPPGLHVVVDDGVSDITSWMPSMVSAGVRQFLVSEEIASDVAEATRSSDAALVLVTAWEEGHGWGRLGLADLPTAFVQPDHQPPEVWLDYVMEGARMRPSHAHYVLVKGGLRVRGRPLSQVASVHPPRALDDFFQETDRRPYVGSRA